VPPAPAPEVTTILWPLANPHREPPQPSQRGVIDVSDVITRALTAAGLLK